MRLMALDVGDATIGVAVCDELGITTRGVTTIRRKGLKQDLPALARLVEAERPERLVVGLPLNMDGTEGPRAEKTRRFAEKVREAIDLPLVFCDERLSTWEAGGVLKDAGVKPSRRKKVIDQVAAQVILRAYLDAGCPPPEDA